jgi:2-oxoglutarate dehydrogenase E1 component
LLRAKASRSPVTSLTAGSFEEVLDDPEMTDSWAASIERVVFCSGKVGVEAIAAREKLGGIEQIPVAVVRIEQLYPWPYEAVDRVLARYSGAREICWLQEEPENMGPWNFVKGRFYERHGDTHEIHRVSRAESASPATGVYAIHLQEQQQLFDETFAR